MQAQAANIAPAAERDRLAAARPVQHRRARDGRRGRPDDAERVRGPRSRAAASGARRTAASNWTNVWPDHFTQPIGAMARGSDGTLWVGTGEQNPPGGGLTYFGDGVYKSTDNGATWTNVGLRQSEAIGRIRVDPTEPAARVRGRDRPRRPLARRSAACTAPRTAARRGSSCWSRRRRPRARSTSRSTRRTRTSSTRRCGIAGAPTAPASTAASAPACSAPRTAARRGSASRTSSTGCAPYDQTQTGLTSHASLGRIGVEIAPSNPNIVYIVFGNQTGPDKGFYRSDDGGDSFACPRTTAGACAPRLPRQRRLPVVVRPHLGRSGEPGPSSSTPTSNCARSTNGGSHAGRAIARHRARRSARHRLGSVDGRRQPGDAEPRLPRQRRRHVQVGEQRRRGVVGRGHEPAMEPDLLALGLAAGLAAAGHRPAGQRQPEVLDRPDDPRAV